MQYSKNLSPAELRKSGSVPPRRIITPDEAGFSDIEQANKLSRRDRAEIFMSDAKQLSRELWQSPKISSLRGRTADSLRRTYERAKNSLPKRIPSATGELSKSRLPFSFQHSHRQMLLIAVGVSLIGLVVVSKSIFTGSSSEMNTDTNSVLGTTALEEAEQGEAPDLQTSNSQIDGTDVVVSRQPLPDNLANDPEALRALVQNLPNVSTIDQVETTQGLIFITRTIKNTMIVAYSTNTELNFITIPRIVTNQAITDFILSE